MTPNSEALSKKLDRVKKAIERFPAAAATLNNATDQLGKSVGDLDAVLKKFSLGVPTWVQFSRFLNEDAGCRYYEELGYAKIGGRWGISIRTVGQEVGQQDDIEQWLFGDAPRLLRVQAIEKIPDLLEALLESAGDMSKRIAEKAEEVDFLASGINSVIDAKASQTHSSRFKAKLNEALRSDDAGSVSLTQGSVNVSVGQPQGSVSVSGPNFIQNPHLTEIGLQAREPISLTVPNFFQDPALPATGSKAPTSPRNLLAGPDPAGGKARK
jgi:ABC-type transporter Mla subunit MlaD